MLFERFHARRLPHRTVGGFDVVPDFNFRFDRGGPKDVDAAVQGLRDNGDRVPGLRPDQIVRAPDTEAVKRWQDPDGDIYRENRIPLANSCDWCSSIDFLLTFLMINARADSRRGPRESLRSRQTHATR